VNNRERRQQAEADARWRAKQARTREWVRGVALAAGVEVPRLINTDAEAVGDLIRDLARAVPKS